MMHTKANISPGLVTKALNGPSGSSGFLVTETNRNKQRAEVIMKRATCRDARAENLVARTAMIFQPSTNFNKHVVELRA